MAAILSNPLVLAASRDTAGAMAVAQATDVIRQWRPQQHLYVKGNLGASAAALDSLEEWLDTQATNWVVVLVENADGETYTDAEGQRGGEGLRQLACAE